MDERDPGQGELASLIQQRLSLGHPPGRIAIDLELAQPGLGREMLPHIHNALTSQREQSRMVRPLAMARPSQRTCSFIAVNGQFVPTPQRASPGLPALNCRAALGLMAGRSLIGRQSSGTNGNVAEDFPKFGKNYEERRVAVMPAGGGRTRSPERRRSREARRARPMDADRS